MPSKETTYFCFRVSKCTLPCKVVSLTLLWQFPTYVCVKLYLINYSSQKVLRAFLVSFVSGRIAEEKRPLRCPEVWSNCAKVKQSRNWPESRQKQTFQLQTWIASWLIMNTQRDFFSTWTFAVNYGRVDEKLTVW